MDIVSLGELLIDMFPAEIGRSFAEVSAFRPVPGGAPANVAVAAVRLGAQSAFIGKVGDDPFGHHLAETLARQGVETRGIRFDREARTGLNFHAQLDEHRIEHFFYRHPSADMRLHVDDLDISLLQTTRVFQFSSLSLSDQPCRDATLAAAYLAHAAGALISFDVNYRPSLWRNAEEARERLLATIPLANVLKVNEDELLLLTGSSDPDDGTRLLAQLGPDLCVVTLGRQGSFYRCGEARGYVPGFAVRAVDTTGSGDAFTAALLVQLIADNDDWRTRLTPAQLQVMLRRANAAGALTACIQGVFSALPTAAAVTAFIEQFPDE
jgi:fructokinase